MFTVFVFSGVTSSIWGICVCRYYDDKACLYTGKASLAALLSTVPTCCCYSMHNGDIHFYLSPLPNPVFCYYNKLMYVVLFLCKQLFTCPMVTCPLTTLLLQQYVAYHEKCNLIAL